MFASVDIGGTNTKVAASEDLKTISRFEAFPTPKNFDAGIERIIEVIRNFSPKDPKAIAIGIPGILNNTSEKLTASPNLPRWVNQPIKKKFSRAFRSRLFVEHDADMGGLGEAAFGSGKKHRIVGFVAIGTGVGGTKIVDKKIDASLQGFEPGHQIIDPRGRYWAPCGQKGCLESFVCAKAFLALYGIKAHECHAKRIWNNWSMRMAHGVTNAIALWSPEIIVIGGGFSEKASYFLSPLKANVKKTLSFFPPPPIVKGMLGDRSGVYGGLWIIKKELSL